jgi:hypothetical protein
MKTESARNRGLISGSVLNRAYGVEINQGVRDDGGVRDWGEIPSDEINNPTNQSVRRGSGFRDPNERLASLDTGRGHLDSTKNRRKWPAAGGVTGRGDPSWNKPLVNRNTRSMGAVRTTGGPGGGDANNSSYYGGPSRRPYGEGG